MRCAELHCVCHCSMLPWPDAKPTTRLCQALWGYSLLLPREPAPGPYAQPCTHGSKRARTPCQAASAVWSPATEKMAAASPALATQAQATGAGRKRDAASTKDEAAGQEASLASQVAPPHKVAALPTRLRKQGNTEEEEKESMCKATNRAWCCSQGWPRGNSTLHVACHQYVSKP